MPNRPRLVVLTGIDGCGKSTVAEMLVYELSERGLRARVLWARRTGRYTKVIKRFVKRLLGEYAETSDRTETFDGVLTHRRKRFRWGWSRNMLLLVTLLEHRLDLGWARWAWSDVDVLFLDRYYIDTIVDHRLAFGETKPEIPVWVRLLAQVLFPHADVSVLLWVSPQVAQTRKQDGTSERYIILRAEQYRLLASASHLVSVDAAQTPKQVTAEVLAILDLPA